MEERRIAYGSTVLRYALARTERRTLGLIVHPDTRVEVRAPHGAPSEKVDALVLRKARWIMRQQDFFRSFLPIAPPRQYVSGESHGYLGRQYRLRIVQDRRERVALSGGRLNVHLRDPSDRDRVRGLLAAWYRTKALQRFQHAVDAALPLFKKERPPRPAVFIKRFHKRWGSCTPSGTIFLNPELLKAPPRCIDYVVIHELAHLIHADHSARYYQLLDRTMPDWVRWKDRLERIG